MVPRTARVQVQRRGRLAVGFAKPLLPVPPRHSTIGATSAARGAHRPRVTIGIDRRSIRVGPERNRTIRTPAVGTCAVGTRAVWTRAVWIDRIARDSEGADVAAVGR